MFDSAPSNLPTEPQTPSAPPSPPQPQIEPQQATPQPEVKPDEQSAINISGKKEPEDIFADVDPAAAKKAPQPQVPLQPVKSKAGFPWKVVLGIGIPIIIIGLGIGGWYVYKSFETVSEPASPIAINAQPTAIPATAEPANEATEKEMIPEPNEDAMAASQATLSLLQSQAEKEQQAMEAVNTENTQMQTSTAENLAMKESETTETQPVEPPVTAPIIETGPLSFGVDTDNDGLTNSEELILGTDPNKSDSDGDGYDDASELGNGYDPAAAGLKLIDSEYITELSIGTLDTIMPATWQKKPGATGSVIIQTGTPASITVEFESYTDSKPLMDWLLAKYPGTTNADFTTGKNVINADVIYSIDKTTAWMLSGNTIYTFRYATNGSTTIDYQNIFSLMIENAQ